MCLLMEGLPVDVVIDAAIVAIPLIVIHQLLLVAFMDRAMPLSTGVGVGDSAPHLVIALGVRVGAVLMEMVTGTAPYAVFMRGALPVPMVGVELPTFAATVGVREGAVVRAIARAWFVVEVGHVSDAEIVQQAQLGGFFEGEVAMGQCVIAGISDCCCTREIRVEALHDMAVAEAVLDFLVAEGPLFLIMLECYLSLAQ